jgi:MFS superfamily sulfate permease-like transporter
MWQEFAFLQRLGYVTFKRAVWMFETLMFLCTCILVLHADFSAGVTMGILTIALLRVLTEAFNHMHVAQAHNVQDRWQLLYPFG